MFFEWAMNKRNIILLGFMGTGKSTVGRLVAGRLGRTFIDMDGEIEARTGKKISQIFAEDGEARFRELEQDLVRELAAKENLVIAGGGGIVLNPRNMGELERTGVLICLTANPDALYRRVAAARHRPLLEGGDKRAKLTALFEKRKPLYDAMKNRIDTSELTTEAVADEVISLFNRAMTDEGQA